MASKPHHASIWRDAAILLIFALVWRGATFGDPNVHADEAFYFLVGQEMHRGAVPIIDLWDRKPFGLFAIYWAIAAFSHNVLAYQLVAAVFAAATALLLGQIARLWTSGWVPLMAGIAYLTSLDPVLGMGGQSPVFYNLLIAGAALLLLGGWVGDDVAAFRRRHLTTIALCGLALTIKPTCVFEGVFFGLAGLWWMAQRGVPAAAIAGQAALCIVIAAAPTAGIAGWYTAHGYGAEWWNAMVTSNLRRQGIGLNGVAHNIYAITRLLAVLIGTVAIGIAAHRRVPHFAPYQALMLGWLAVAIGGFLTMPNYFAHYALPLLVPMVPLAAIAFTIPRIGPVLLMIVAVISAILGRSFDYGYHRASREGFEHMAAAIERYRDNRPLVMFNGPILLYTTTGAHPASPLTFPEHLINPLERDVSHIGTAAETRRLLALRPGVIVMPAKFNMVVTDGLLNELQSHLAANCRVVWQGATYEPRAVEIPVLMYACR